MAVKKDGRSAQLDRTECRVCGRMMTNKYMAYHMQQKHNALVPVSVGEVEVVHKANGRMHYKELTDFRVLEDSDGSIWIAERIR